MLLGESRLLGYAAGNFGKNLVWSTADFTILYFLTDLIGLTAREASGLLLVMLLGDLGFDIAAGWVTTRCLRMGFGYRALVAMGAVPGGLAFAALYVLPVFKTPPVLLLAATLLIFRAAYAVMDVPHNTLLAQVTQDSRTRGRVSGYRLAFSTVAALMVASFVTPAMQHPSPARLALIAAFAGCLFMLTMLLSAAATQDTTACDATDTPVTSLRCIAVILRDPLVLAIMAIAFLTGFAAPAFERMLLYLARYVLPAGTDAGTILLTLTLGQFAGVIMWTALTRRVGKAHLLTVGHLVTMVGLAAFAVAAWTQAPLLAASALIGFGLASVFMLPWGILADLADFVQFRHGTRMQTALFAMFLVVVKASAAASNWFIGQTLFTLGYDPGVAQGLPVKLGMMILALGVPMTGCACAAALALRLRVDDMRHERILTALRHGRTRIAPPSLRNNPKKAPGSGVQRIERIHPG